MSNKIPKEKAKELIKKFAYAVRSHVDDEGFMTNINHAKESALICVDEEIKTLENLWSKYSCDCLGYALTELEQVKKEIEQL